MVTYNDASLDLAGLYAFEIVQTGVYQSRSLDNLWEAESVQTGVYQSFSLDNLDLLLRSLRLANVILT